MSATPSFGEAIEQVFGAQLGQLRAIDIGEVTAWDRSDQTATVRPTILGPNREARAPIPRCAVVFPGAYWDIQVGESGLLLVCDSDYRRWWRDGEDAVPATRQSHAIGNSVFLPGIRSRSLSRTLPADATVLEKPCAGGEVRLGEQGADKSAMHESLEPDLNAFLLALNTFGVCVDGVTGCAWAPVGNAITTLTAGILMDMYHSPSVMVED